MLVALVRRVVFLGHKLPFFRVDLREPGIRLKAGMYPGELNGSGIGHELMVYFASAYDKGFFKVFHSGNCHFHRMHNGTIRVGGTVICIPGDDEVFSLREGFGKTLKGFASHNNGMP